MNRELFRLDEISWRGLCMDLLRNAWMILMAAAAVWFAATGLYNITYEPAYTASATLVVTVRGESSAYTSLSVASSMADVFGQVFQSEALRNRIIEDVGEEIQGTITCAPIEETNLLVLSTTCPDPRQAYLFINSALQHYEEVAGDVFANASLQIVQEPEVPSEPSNSSWLLTRRTLLALGGAFAMACLICLFYVLRFTVKNAVCASRQLDGRIRGTIPFERKSGALLQEGSLLKREKSKQALLLTSPLVSMDFAEAQRRAEARTEAHMRRKGQQVLLVTSVTENEGKSTIAANIALAMAEKHKKVLVVDGDLRQPSQYKIFERRERRGSSLENVLKDGTDWHDVVMYNEKDSISQIFQFRAASDPSRLMNRLAETGLVEEWKKEFDYIVIDCSPTAVSTDAEIWMALADTVLLVVREDWADVRVINDTVDMIWQSGKDFAGFVLNAFHREWGAGSSEYGYGGYGQEKG